MGNANALIAVVDDELAVRTMLRRALRLADYDVTAFASGEEFLDSLQAQHPACVVLDVHMPGLSGFDVVQRMRIVGVGVPAVLITASDDRAIDRLAAAAGAAGLLRKPFSIDALLTAINRASDGRPDNP